jgi:hypothetical protein
MKGNTMSLDYLTLSELEYVYEDFDRKYDRDDDDLQSRHMEYIMEHCGGDRMICNGDMLIEAQEEGYLYEDFRDYCLEDYGVMA